MENDLDLYLWDSYSHKNETLSILQRTLDTDHTPLPRNPKLEDGINSSHLKLQTQISHKLYLSARILEAFLRHGAHHETYRGARGDGVGFFGLG